jgi:Flp pilus assembly pilin Flp
MRRWKAELRSTLCDQSGATLAEYAVIAAALGVLMLAALKLIQTETGTQLTTAGNGLTALGVNPP